jgi:hypothetical protein
MNNISALFVHALGMYGMGWDDDGLVIYIEGLSTKIYF